jgi:hypothetical protein
MIVLLDRTVSACSPTIKRICIDLPGCLGMREKTSFNLIGLVRAIAAVAA